MTALNKNARIVCLSNLFLRWNRSFTNRVEIAKDSREFEGVVGLEVHAQIKSKSKLFSRSPVTFGLPTNTNVSYFDAALPGTLPVLNKQCIEAGILTALACNCTVNNISMFDRKHYFYPDLPAGYQITQQFHPLAINGHINFIVHGKEREDVPYECCAYLKQLQLEQDSGRSFHVSEDNSFVDLNRAGIALMELVFEPNLRNGIEAASLIRELICILKRIDTCSCELEEGTLRVDANISVNKKGDPLGIRTEVKNINSMRYVARAIDFEIKRQIEILEAGGTVINETRAYDYTAKCTKFMRDKEMLQDYRFMPEPNLPPIEINDKSDENDSITKDCLNLNAIRKRLPSLPDGERTRLVESYQLPVHLADKLVHSDGLSEAFETIASCVKDYSMICNYLLTSVQSQLNVRKLTIKKSELSYFQLTELMQLLASKQISDITADSILALFFEGDKRLPKQIVEANNWRIISDEKELEMLCTEVLSAHPKVVKMYIKKGKKQDMNLLLQAVLLKTDNRVSVKDVSETFKRLISKKIDVNK